MGKLVQPVIPPEGEHIDVNGQGKAPGSAKGREIGRYYVPSSAGAKYPPLTAKETMLAIERTRKAQILVDCQFCGSEGIWLPSRNRVVHNGYECSNDRGFWSLQ